MSGPSALGKAERAMWDSAERGVAAPGFLETRTAGLFSCPCGHPRDVLRAAPSTPSLTVHPAPPRAGPAREPRFQPAPSPSRQLGLLSDASQSTPVNVSCRKKKICFNFKVLRTLFFFLNRIMP